MENNVDITINDFENICRTCLSRDREGLHPLYEKYLAEMLMTCTVVKYAENDGFPTKICTNCINEINKAFSFAKRCTATDKILRKCVLKLETEAANNSSHSQKVQPTIETQEEIKQEIIYRTVKEVLRDYGSMEKVKQEEDVKMEFEETWMEVVGDTKIEIKYDETYDGPVDESNKEEIDDEVQNEKYSDNSGFWNRRSCTNSQIEKKTLRSDDCNEVDVNRDETYSEKPDHSGPRLKSRCAIFQKEKNISKEDDLESYDAPEHYQEEGDDEEMLYSEKVDSSGSRHKRKFTNSQKNYVEDLEKSDKSGSRPKRRCTISYIEKNCSNDDHKTSDNYTTNKSYEEDDDEYLDETYLKKPDTPASKTTNPQIKERSTMNKIGQHKYDRHSQSSKRIYQSQTCEKSFNKLDLLNLHQKGYFPEKSDKSGSRPKRRCTISQVEKNRSIDNDDETSDTDTTDKSYEEQDDDEDLDETYSEKPNNPVSKPMRKTTNPQIKEGRKKNKISQHKYDRHFQSSNQIYQSKTCEKSSNKLDLLIHHQKGIHTGGKPHICKVCSKAFPGSSNLQTHLRTHTGEKPYDCKVCSKTFSLSARLQRHLRTHTGEKPYDCKVCRKMFSLSENLQRHMRIHTGEKPYDCNVCSKTFSRSSHRKIHMRLHTGEKPHMCKECNKTFAQSSHLKGHMRTHTGEKPYDCKVCSKTFSTSSSLHIHMRTHTGEKPYDCKVCRKMFSLSENLQRHMRIHTREEALRL